ncbi:MAG: Na(+)-translocating NADH-quinone reductase subunit A [Candidatus Omnitrophica bacterium]|nr:Na(+)-translocating NADH-quinone reductase subunit A [Candidatus Omnitrophota bacterium]
MQAIRIKKGRTIPLKGGARLELKVLSRPSEILFPFFEFPPHQFRLVIKEGDRIQTGAPIAEDRDGKGIVLVSPVTGVIKSLNRGPKRALLSVTIQVDGDQSAVAHGAVSGDSLSREAVIDRLLKGGVWPFLRQRPFMKIADPKAAPKSVFIHAMQSDPLAPDIGFILEGKEKDFQAGLDILRRLTTGKTYLCFDAATLSKALLGAKNVECAGFSGPHPAGNVGTHIHALDPIGKNEVVWFIEAQDVLRVARLFTDGVFDPKKVIAVTGEAAQGRAYVQTVLGAPVAHLLGEAQKNDARYISGSVLSGTEVGYAGTIGWYHAQLTVIPAGGARKLFGWIDPGFNAFSFTRTVASSFLPKKEVSLDTDMNGGHRAIVLSDIYDDLNAIDIMPVFLIRAIYANEVEEMIRLGIFECAAEDFTLCNFACPSKVDVSGIIQRGLDLMEKEA